MKRRTFDTLLIALGLTMMLVLMAAGGLLTWAHSFIGGQVRTQPLPSSRSNPANGMGETRASPVGTRQHDG